MKISTVYNNLKPLFEPYPFQLEKPQVIQFPVIDICNSKCQMCRIWENKQSSDITVADLQKGLTSDLFSEVSSIGFNGGEPTLRDDLKEVVQTCVDGMPKLKAISLITNAYKYKQVIEKIEQIGIICKKNNINFDVMISLDGFEEVHDKVRGKTGNFKNAQHVIKYAKESADVDNVRIGCTIIKENVFHLTELLEFCIKNELYIKYRLGIPHQRLYTENLLDPYALTFTEKYELVEFLEGLIESYEKSIMQNFFYRSLINQILYQKPREAGCNWKHRGATITAKGELAYCAVQSKTLMPNIATGDPKQAYFSNEKHLQDIIKNDCDNCNHDYTGKPSPQVYRRLLGEYLKSKLNLRDKLKKIPGLITINDFKKKKAYLEKLKTLRANDSISNVAVRKSKSVLICGWYGTETLGDKAILAGIILAFKKYLGEDTQIIIASLNKYICKMTQLQMPELKSASVVSIDEALYLSKKVDYMVFGGGPLMAINALAPMHVMFENAKENGAKTIVASCGVGPLGDEWLNDSIAAILKLSDVKIYRDEKSLRGAQSLGVDIKNDFVAEDPAFTWLASIKQAIQNEQTDKVQSKKVLMLGLRDFPYQEYARDYSKDDSIKIKDNYEKSVIKSLEKLVETNPNLIIKPLPMCTNHFGSDDRWFYRKLFRYSDKLNDYLDYSLLGKELAPIDYAEQIAAADGLVAMRFHSLVFGLGLDVSSMAIDYTMGKGKVRSLAEKYDVPNIAIQNLNSESLLNMYLELLNTKKPSTSELELKFCESFEKAVF
ncbi:MULTISPECIES: polysaccharide pyruvyl transferase family protein [unclassified Pseudoalteromonas]|uniref:polysaccharide pyruvyl transferase family protein n=1 Tax=unclassified Pseudoalteromonas TaxID=194690 RepID=UPI00301504DF